MTKALIVINNRVDRDRAARLIATAPTGSRVEVKGARRTLPQNDKMWAMLTDVSRQAEWAGKRRTPDQWKDLFTGSLLAERDALEIVPGLSGGFMVMGLRTSDLGIGDMADLITWIQAWGDQHGVVWSDSNDQAHAA